MAFRLAPSEPPLTRRQKRPRQKAEPHLAFIRELPCVACGTWPVEAAHIRYASDRNGKRAVGTGEKPSDCWAVPLCPGCHRDQHSGNEAGWWARQGIDPLPVALALWAATGDVERGELIIREARKP